MTDSRRRVLIRVIGAPLLLATLGGILYWDYTRRSILGLTAVMTILTLGGLYEFYKMCERKGYKPALYVGLLAALAVMTRPVIRDSLGESYRTLLNIASPQEIVLIYLALKMIFCSNSFGLPDAALSFFGFAFLALWADLLYLGSFHVRYSTFRADSWLWLLMFLLATNKGNDMAAYLFGKLLGKSKVAPIISPNKTWVGTIAGVACGSILAFFVLQVYWSSVQMPYSRVSPYLMPIALLVTIAATLGDLAESAIKRWAGVKDSGGVLPEFGGVLDMIDGFLVSVPLCITIWHMIYQDL